MGGYWSVDQHYRLILINCYKCKTMDQLVFFFAVDLCFKIGIINIFGVEIITLLKMGFTLKVFKKLLILLQEGTFGVWLHLIS